MLTDGMTDAGWNVMTKAHLQNEGELKSDKFDSLSFLSMLVRI